MSGSLVLPCTSAEGNQLSESLMEKTVTSLNEIIGVVLELLEAAKVGFMCLC